MKVGSLVYATAQGLGVLAKSFYDAGILTDVFIVRHSSRKTHEEWYPPGTPSDDIRRVAAGSKHARRFVERMDAMLFFETPFDWGLIGLCREKGVKTVLMPMHECMHEKIAAQPDAIVCPSLLDARVYPKGVYVPVPADPGIPWRLRRRVETYVHNAGHGGLQNRNGTGVLIDAVRLARKPFRLILRSQAPLQWSADDPKIDLRIGDCPREKLYEEGDAFVFPERFNGLSLPLQEACAAGMAVMATDRFPNNAWLPLEPLIPVESYRKNRIGRAYNEFNEAQIDPQILADHLDRWYGAPCEQLSLAGKAWAEANSWANLKPRYMELLT